MPNKKSIFNIAIKDVAKKMVKAFEGKVKQTEALNVLAKIEGYPSYNKDYRDMVNADKVIEEHINKELDKLTKEWKNLDKVLKIDSDINLDGYYDLTKEQKYYRMSMEMFLETFFCFDDNTKLYIEKSVYGIEIEKRILPLDFEPIDSNETEKIIDELKELGIIQNLVVPPKLHENLFKLHPRRFVEYFKKIYPLKYKGYCGYFHHEYLYPVNKDIQVTVSEPYLFSKDSIDIGTKKIDFAVTYYLIDIDYVIPNHDIKIRLSYKYCLEDLFVDLKSFFYNVDEVDGEIDSQKEKVLRVKLEEELKDGRDGEWDGLISCSIPSSEVNFFHTYCLCGFQVAKINEDFNCKISDFKANGFLELHDFLSQNDMLTWITPKSIFDLLKEYKDLSEILKKDSLINYEIIDHALENLDSDIMEDTDKWGSVEDKEFNHVNRLNDSVFNYIFSSIDDSLIYILNNNAKEKMIDAYMYIIKNKAEIESRFNDNMANYIPIDYNEYKKDFFAQSFIEENSLTINIENRLWIVTTVEDGKVIEHKELSKLANKLIRMNSSIGFDKDAKKELVDKFYKEVQEKVDEVEKANM